jgi:hypothetical protein
MKRIGKVKALNMKIGNQNLQSGKLHMKFFIIKTIRMKIAQEEFLALIILSLVLIRKSPLILI